jgi:hypothetical protein
LKQSASNFLLIWFDFWSRRWHRNTDAHSLSPIVKHTEGFCCAVRQIDAALGIHFGQKWPAILHHNTHALTTKADMQKSAKGQSSVCGNEFIVAINLAIRQKPSPFRWR